MKQHSRRTLAVIAPAVVLVGCLSAISEAPAVTDHIDVVLANESAIGVSLIGPNEELSAANHVRSGDNRQIRVIAVTAGREYTFEAGVYDSFSQYWIRLAFVTCTVREPVRRQDRIVSYRAPQAMVCENW